MLTLVPTAILMDLHSEVTRILLRLEPIRMKRKRTRPPSSSFKDHPKNSTNSISFGTLPFNAKTPRLFLKLLIS
jgi:hypothetical protein